MIVWLMKRLNLIILLNNMKDNFDKLFNVVLGLTCINVVISVVVLFKAIMLA